MLTSRVEQAKEVIRAWVGIESLFYSQIWQAHFRFLGHQHNLLNAVTDLSSFARDHLVGFHVQFTFQWLATGARLYILREVHFSLDQDDWRELQILDLPDFAVRVLDKLYLLWIVWLEQKHDDVRSVVQDFVSFELARCDCFITDLSHLKVFGCVFVLNFQVFYVDTPDHRIVLLDLFMLADLGLGLDMSL